MCTTANITHQTAVVSRPSGTEGVKSECRKRAGGMAPCTGVAGEEPRGESSKTAGTNASTGAAVGGGFPVRLTGLPGRILMDTAAAMLRKSSTVQG